MVFESWTLPIFENVCECTSLHPTFLRKTGGELFRKCGHWQYWVHFRVFFVRQPPKIAASSVDLDFGARNSLYTSLAGAYSKTTRS